MGQRNDGEMQEKAEESGEGKADGEVQRTGPGGDVADVAQRESSKGTETAKAECAREMAGKEQGHGGDGRNHGQEAEAGDSRPAVFAEQSWEYLDEARSGRKGPAEEFAGREEATGGMDAYQVLEAGDSNQSVEGKGAPEACENESANGAEEAEIGVESLERGEAAKAELEEGSAEYGEQAIEVAGKENLRLRALGADVAVERNTEDEGGADGVEGSVGDLAELRSVAEISDEIRRVQNEVRTTEMDGSDQTYLPNEQQQDRAPSVEHLLCQKVAEDVQGQIDSDFRDAHEHGDGKMAQEEEEVAGEPKKKSKNKKKKKQLNQN